MCPIIRINQSRSAVYFFMVGLEFAFTWSSIGAFVVVNSGADNDDVAEIYITVIDVIAIITVVLLLVL